ncbi:MAG: hypothetical protein ABIV25_01130 [Paracoccaceae bacterium]
MEKAFLTPISNEEGDVRDLTDAEYLWIVSGKEHGGFDGVMAFLESRSRFLKSAEEAGFEREVFLSFEPTKPGFVERALAALDSLVKKARHAAE